MKRTIILMTIFLNAITLSTLSPAIEIRTYEDTILLRKQLSKIANQIITEAEETLQNNPDDEKAAEALLIIGLANGQYGKEDFKKSEKILKEGIEKYPNSKVIPLFKYWLADIYVFARPGVNGKISDGNKIHEEMLKEYAGTEWEPRIKLQQALSLYHFAWDQPDTKSRDTVNHIIKIFQDISDNYSGTDSAGVALCNLANYYAVYSPDKKKAKEYCLELIKSYGSKYSNQYIEIINGMMDNSFVLIRTSKNEVSKLAPKVIRRYPAASSNERSNFNRRITSYYYNDWIKEMLAKVCEYAKTKENNELLHDAVILQGMTYFCKERPQECIDHFSKALSEYSALITQKDILLIDDYLAMSAFWQRNYEKSAEMFGDLTTYAPEPGKGSRDAIRTKAYYEYWRGVSLFQGKEHEKSKTIFKSLIETYPKTKWAQLSEEYIEYIEPLLSITPVTADNNKENNPKSIN